MEKDCEKYLFYQLFNQLTNPAKVMYIWHRLIMLYRFHHLMEHFCKLVWAVGQKWWTKYDPLIFWEEKDPKIFFEKDVKGMKKWSIQMTWNLIHSLLRCISKTLFKFIPLATLGGTPENPLLPFILLPSSYLKKHKILKSP